MRKSFESLLIEHCAPTLARVKTANMFSYRTYANEVAANLISHWNQQLNSYGIALKILKQFNNEDIYLVYVYRKNALYKDIKQIGVESLLKKYGYTNFTSIEAHINQLSKNLESNETFPHEIGLFLGYPLNDVKGFIKNKGKNYHCIGCWKVYSDPQIAQKCFDRYKKCTAIYKRMYSGGRSVFQLTVAA